MAPFPSLRSLRRTSFSSSSYSPWRPSLSAGVSYPFNPTGHFCWVDIPQSSKSQGLSQNGFGGTGIHQQGRMVMKHLRGIASGLVIAIAIMMAASTASSQLNIRVNTRNHPRHVVVHHPRQHARARIHVAERRPDVVRHDDRRMPERH